jgi:spore maturation protein CgeB
LLYQADDPADLADKINQLYENEQLRTAISFNALDLDNSFDCRTKNMKIIAELTSLAKEPRA